MTLQTEQNQVKVRATLGTYQTSRVRGFAASCSAGPEQAARALGCKLYGDALVSVTALSKPAPIVGVTHWLIEGPLEQQAGKP